MIIQEIYTLSNGVEIPKLGLGTWFINDRDVAQAVRSAADIGYRHIDTAQAYRNEKGVGKGIRTCSVPRNEMFITTKLAAEAKTYKKAAAAIDGSLKKLGLEYIDMMIIHSPQPWIKFRSQDRFLEGNREAWRALEEAYKAGKIRAIGLSIFDKVDLVNILSSCTVKPMVNQILAHISNVPTELITYCQAHDILVEAYSPVGHGELFKNKEIVRTAAKYHVTVPQLAIRYDLQLGLLPLPKTANPEHMINNADLAFTISDEDMNMLTEMETIKDYGDASVMPVYGGKLDLKALLAMIFPRRKNRKSSLETV